MTRNYHSSSKCPVWCQTNWLKALKAGVMAPVRWHPSTAENGLSISTWVMKIFSLAKPIRFVHACMNILMNSEDSQR